MKKSYFCADCTDEEFKKFSEAIKTLISLANKEILPRFLSGTQVFDKKDHTPVTQADRGAELSMRRWIEEHFPEHAIFGEEFGVKEPTTSSYPKYRWVLDPIDGTRAFISNAFHFGTLIALEKDDGEGFSPLIGCISHPHVGVFLIGNGKKTLLFDNFGNSRSVHVRDTDSLSESTLLVTSHWTTPEQKGNERIQKIIDQVKLYRTWGDCFGYFSVSTGGADIMLDPDLNYWDVAALVPIVEGSGGVLRSFKGGNPLKDLSAIATNEKLLPRILNILNS